MKNSTNYGIDWKAVDLTQAYNRDQNILDSYNFETLFLEIHCNMREEEKTAANILKHACEVLNSKMELAKEILIDNIYNITDYAKK